MTPLEFPAEVLEKLQLDRVFKESAEYHLECAEKLQLYREEKLIKPLYEESRAYVEEIKHTLYALTLNKNLDRDAREVFYNYLCFDKDHTQTIRSYFRNLADKYTGTRGSPRQAAQHLLPGQQRVRETQGRVHRDRVQRGALHRRRKLPAGLRLGRSRRPPARAAAAQRRLPHDQRAGAARLLREARGNPAAERPGPLLPPVQRGPGLLPGQSQAAAQGQRLQSVGRGRP